MYTHCRALYGKCTKPNATVSTVAPRLLEKRLALNGHCCALTTAMFSTHAVPDRILQNSRPQKSIRQIGFGLGIAVYVASFLLPAMNEGFFGWQCAHLSLSLPFSRYGTDFNLFKFILFACGLINPLALVYLVLRISDRSPLLRRGIAVVALSFVPLSWVFMAHLKPPLIPAIGHIAWIAGLLLMMGPEAILGRAGGAT